MLRKKNRINILFKKYGFNIDFNTIFVSNLSLAVEQNLMYFCKYSLKNIVKI